MTTPTITRGLLSFIQENHPCETPTVADFLKSLGAFKYKRRHVKYAWVKGKRVRIPGRRRGRKKHVRRIKAQGGTGR